MSGWGTSVCWPGLGRAWRLWRAGVAAPGRACICRLRRSSWMGPGVGPAVAADSAGRLARAAPSHQAARLPATETPSPEPGARGPGVSDLGGRLCQRGYSQCPRAPDAGLDPESDANINNGDPSTAHRPSAGTLDGLSISLKMRKLRHREALLFQVRGGRAGLPLGGPAGVWGEALHLPAQTLIPA